MTQSKRRNGESLESRCQILVEYAKWTARAAVNAGGPIKDKDTIYALLDGVTFSEVLDPSLGRISCQDFNAWHECQTEDLCSRAKEHLLAHQKEQEPAVEFPVGWSAKLINVFLKTAVYAGGLGREGLRDVLHPPLDNGLKKGLKKHFKACSACRAEVDFGAISTIKDYNRYRRVIAGCWIAACCLGCSLIEVEQLAGLGLRDGEDPPGKLVSQICGSDVQ